NPIKFMHPFHLALLVLFAYGLQGMWQRYLSREKGEGRREKGSDAPDSFSSLPSSFSSLKSWWSKTTGFEKRWAQAWIAAVIVSLLALVIYGGSQSDLAAHLTANGFDLDSAKKIAAFSVGEVGKFVLFLAVAVGLVTLIQSGYFAGARAKWAGVL